MTITKKHFINIAKIIDDNSKHNDDDKKILVNALSNYFKSENKNFDSIRFYNACFKTFKSVSDDQKKAIKVLQSKVNTYEADIDKGIYVYRDNCYCVKCKQQRKEWKVGEYSNTQ